MSTEEAYLVYPPTPKDAPERFTAAEMRFIRWIEEAPRDEQWLATQQRRSVKIYRLTAEQVANYLREVRGGASWVWAARILDVSRQRLWSWLKRGEKRAKGGAERPFVLLHDATRAAEAVAIAESEHRVKIDDPKSWLARRARSQPGYVGWEPDALKVDLSTSQGPLRIERVTDSETVEQESERLLQALEVLRGLGLANERMLIGSTACGSEEDTDTE